MPKNQNINELVTAKWLQAQFVITRVKVIDVAQQSGIDRSQISAYKNGRTMSAPVKAFFYYYFESFHLNRINQQLKSHE